MDFAMYRGVPQCTIEDYEQGLAGRHRVHDTVSYWARRKPDAAAIINASTRAELTWTEFENATTALAMKLIEMVVDVAVQDLLGGVTVHRPGDPDAARHRAPP